ncbi:MAG TPA: M67 family metallopeptidase [Pyrinomonadaceae bacterium]|jgi:proteasome lid subunit RPN8/RPN11
MIKLARAQLAEMRCHAERVYPHECCGLLIGQITDDGRTRLIAETYPVENEFDRAALSDAFADSEATQAQAVPAAAGEDRHRRMLIPPQAYLRAERLYAARGLGVVGNYHSHPEHPAVPSQFDLAHLAPWPTMSYIVVSVRAGKAAELRSWELAADGARFNEEEIVEGA